MQGRKTIREITLCVARVTVHICQATRYVPVVSQVNWHPAWKDNVMTFFY